ncbi:contactin-associated protein 1 [Lingula anatina]|nr:contactin-associated protein 1 [Lingula anatina]|eukprot:XP_013419353.1 contactin-associated protein 1 [Lingula anatina]
MAQMLSVINASTSCKQYLKVRCIGTYFFGSLTEAGHNIYWSSRDGERMLYWGGGNPNGWGCACALDNTCVSSNLGLCNCNTNDGNWREDEGYVTDTSKLPVSQLHGGDTGSSGEEIHFTVGPLECVL